MELFNYGCLVTAAFGQTRHNIKSKAISVTAHGSLYCCEMLRIPRRLDSQLTDGDEVFSLTSGPPIWSPKRNFSVAVIHFYHRLSRHQGLMLAEGLGKLIKTIHLIGFRTRDLPAFSLVP
jgi:hypothetical protein